VLADLEYTERRGSKVDINDLLKYVAVVFIEAILTFYLRRLLAAFHDVGIHFS